MLSKNSKNEREHHDLVSNSKRHSDTKSFDVYSQWIWLNVGGKHFLTTRSTLSKQTSFLSRLCQHDADLKTDVDERGAYLIDRDPKYFDVILNYLRHGKLILENNLVEEGVLEEAEFYNIRSLIELVKERIRERDKKKFDHDTTNRVYRVMQCEEKEVTHLMSSINDGWRFEQLVGHSPVGSSYISSGGEFLCIVSKQYDRNLQEESDGCVSERVKILREKGSRM